MSNGLVNKTKNSLGFIIRGLELFITNKNKIRLK